MGDASIIDACRTPRGIGKQGKGALALLHPQHAVATLEGIPRADLDALERHNGQFGLVTMCACGGMAPAIIIERV